MLSIAQEQFWWSVILVLVSFAAASGRLFVVQNQLLISAHEVERNLALLKGITEGTTDAVFVKDLQGKYIMINTAGARFLGRGAPDIIGKSDAELFAPQVGRTIMERDRQVVQSGETQTYEEFGTAAGVTRLYLSTKGPFRDPGGQVIGLLGICRDITDRKRAEEEIRQSQQKPRIHLDHTPLAVIEWDLNFCVAGWNPSAERIFGYTREEAMGKHGHFIVPAAYRPKSIASGKTCWIREPRIRVRRSCDLDVTTTSQKMAAWFHASGTTLPGRDAGRVLGVASLAQDVSERVLLEDSLRQSQKMEAIGRLAGGVAHDFNNLLTVILGYSQILADGVPACRWPTEFHRSGRPPTKRLESPASCWLSAASRCFSTRHQSQRHHAQPGLLLRRLIGEDIEILTAPARDLGSVKADPGQIEQVIMNLALNSRDAMPHGGKLTLETSNEILDEPFAREREPLVPGHYVMLAVSDTGEGMSGETQARVFEPFYTTKEIGKGTGLGLSMVYGIVKQSGGYIWVYSEPGRGTTFKIYLPRMDQPAESAVTEKIRLLCSTVPKQFCWWKTIPSCAG